MLPAIFNALLLCNPTEVTYLVLHGLIKNIVFIIVLIAESLKYFMLSRQY